ncbi:MAG TPA: phosphotransferase [Candidatus Limnocylindrales bacterium]|nr:phosphotransferase [Candidatus Limnocylindrales bacterium]
METDDDELIGAVAALLADAGRPATRILPGRVIVRPRSVVRFLAAAFPDTTLELVVKEPRGTGDGTARPSPARAVAAPPASGRPRLAMPPAPEVRYEAEYEALRLVADDLTQDPDPALGVVGVLGYVPRRHAIVMEVFHDPTLRHMLYARALGGRRELVGLTAAAGHAGRWLRRYHALPAPASATARQASAGDVAALADEMLAYLVRRAAALGRDDDAAFLRDRAPAVRRALDRSLPAILPTALGHGDFALRNLLVGDGARVTGIDAWAYWLPPVHEDLATWLGSLWTAMPRVLTGGRWIDDATATRLESAFLHGYGAAAVPRDELRAYEAFLLLDRWGSVPGVERSASRSARVRASAMWRAYRRELDRVLDRLPV